MTLANVPVIRVVCWRHLEEACGKLLPSASPLGAGHNDIFIFDNWNAATNNGKRDDTGPEVDSARESRLG